MLGVFITQHYYIISVLTRSIKDITGAGVQRKKNNKHIKPCNPPPLEWVKWNTDTFRIEARPYYWYYVQK